VDFYLQHLAQNLAIRPESLYAEYKKIRMNLSYQKPNYQNRESSDQEQKEIASPSLTDMIAGYIYRYQFLDLFFREFRYTHSDLTAIEDVGLLMRLLSNNLDDEDREQLRILDLILEESQ
jgi:hypothetical protein